jgi:hypothetical protein
MTKVLLLLLFIFVSCQVETPIDLRSQVINANSFTYTQDNIEILKSLSNISTKPILDYTSSYSYTISPQLPVGLSINSSTGEIKGVPATISSSSVYTVTAQNSIERIYASINITVLDEPITSFNYVNQSSQQLENSIIGTVGAPINTIGPYTTGGIPLIYEISVFDEFLLNNNGLSIDTAGVISGTPTASTPNVLTIKIRAVNDSTSLVKSLTIYITEAAPTSIDYDWSTPLLKFTNAYVFPVGTAVSESPTLAPITAVISSYTVSPALPDGLSLDATTGVISGTPAVNTNIESYLIIASNSGGEVSNNISITVTDVGPGAFSYAVPSFYVKNQDIVLLVPPVVTQGVPTNFSISPSLPEGLTLITSSNRDEINTTTSNNFTLGTIQGVPLNVTPSILYTVYASNLYGIETDTFTLEIKELAPSNLTYNLISSFTVGTPIVDLTPTTGGSNPTSYSLDGASNPLPAGLSLSSTTGIISGTPTATVANYPVTVNAINNVNVGSPASVVLSFTIDDLAPSSLSYVNTIPLFCNIPMLALAPTYSGGAPTTYLFDNTLTPLPVGLSLDTNTGIISGTPTASAAPVSLVIAGTNQSGTQSTSVNLQVYPQTPVFSYSSVQIYAGFPAILSPVSTHCGYNEQYTINKALPDGIIFDPVTGSFSANTSNIIIRDDYTVTGKNTGSKSVNTNGLITYSEYDQSSEAKVRLGVDYLATNDFEIVFTDLINFNDDEYTDLLIVEKKCPLLCTSAKIKVYTGSALGAFTLISDQDISDILNAPIYFDLKKVKSVYYNDGDFLTDLVFIEETSHTVFFLQNKQNDLSSPRKFMYFGHTVAPAAVNDVAVIDTDQDEIPEVIVSDSSNNLSIYKFNPATSNYDIRILKQFFQIKGTPGESDALGVGSISSFEVLDHNSDGIIDIVVADQLYKRICFIAGTGDSTSFEDSCAHVIVPIKEPVDIKSDDIDGDSIYDIVTILSNGTLQVYKGDGDTFSTYEIDDTTPEFEKIGVVTNPESNILKISDTNSDCIKDIQVMNKANNEIINYKISASGTEFQIPQIMTFDNISSFSVGSKFTDPNTPSFMMVACSDTDNVCAIPEHLGNQPDANPDGCSYNDSYGDDSYDDEDY